MTRSMSPSIPDDSGRRSRDVIYWIATLFAAVAFVVPGVLNLVQAPHMVGDMAHLGYPPYFPTILGTWKILGALAIVLPQRPRLKEWAYACMVFDLARRSRPRWSATAR
jgi:uncharacterized membrane protein YphA (DoxX/SURF4 family)